MTNEVYLDTIIACGKIVGVDDKIYKELADCGVNLKEYHNSIDKMIDTKTINSLAFLFDNLLRVLDRRNREDIDSYINEYLEFLKVYTKVCKFKSADDFISLNNFMCNSVERNLYNGFKELKQVNVRYISYFMLDGVKKKVSLTNRIDMEDDWTWLEIEDSGKIEHVSFIFIKGTKVEYKKVTSIEETVQVIKRMICESSSYDVVIYPKGMRNVGDRIKRDIFRCYTDTYKIDNKEYLELLKILNYPETQIYGAYENIYKSDINIVKFHKLLYDTLLDDEVSMYSGCVFIDLMLKNASEHNIDLDYVYELMKEKFGIITYNDCYSYLLNLNEMLEKTDLISAIQTDYLRHIKYINIGDKKFEVKNMQILSELRDRYSNSVDYLFIDMIIYRDGTYKIIENGESKVDKNKELLTIIKGKRE